MKKPKKYMKLIPKLLEVKIDSIWKQNYFHTNKR